MDKSPNTQRWEQMNEGDNSKTPHAPPHNDNYEDTINFYVKTSHIEVKLSKTPSIRTDGFIIFDSSDLDNFLLMNDLKKGEMPKFICKKLAEEIGTTPEEVSKAYAAAFSNDELKKKGETAGDKSLYYPGPIHIVEALTQKYRFHTIPEIGTDKEKIYYFNGQIYDRAEELIKSEAHAEYVRQWTEQLNESIIAQDKAHEARMQHLLDRGPSANDINEVIQMIRRTTFTQDEMNPDTHIPFQNGLLNLKTRNIEPFSADRFFTYQISANLLESHVTLKDTPLFNYLLNGVFYEPDIPMALSYAAYALRPDFPVHKVLFILGRERVGKGTFVNVLQGLMPKGSGSMSLARLLTGERFQFTGIEGVNLLIDSETKRKFRRGTVLDWSMFCNLFGGDTLSIEPKGRDAHDYVSKAKGIFLGNLPFIPVDSPPAVARILIVETRNERPKRVIPNLGEKILANERDRIATLLVQVMFGLEDRDFLFPGQLTDDATTDILDKLADPVSNFVEEMTEYQEGINTTASDAVAAFTEWCNSKGISPLKPQMFKKGFGKYYTKKLLGPRGGQEYFYINCKIFDTETELEIQSSFQVDYGVNMSKTKKTSLSGDRYRRNQHECVTLRVRKEEDRDHVHDMRVDTLKLITGNECTGEPKTEAQNDNEPVINLKQENSQEDSLGVEKFTADTMKSDVQSEKKDKQTPITLEDGKLIVDQLLGLGYHIDPNSGPDINMKFFVILIAGFNSLSSETKEKLLYVMAREHFSVVSDGVRSAAFARSLSTTSDNAPQSPVR